MKIQTITCHDVYNAGASLQAFALQKYLENLGNTVEIINYKPDYLSKHYSLTAINNQKYNRPVIRELYLLAKLRKRLKARKSLKKKAFDSFTKQYLHITKETYHSVRQLKKKCPEADLYIAGSDQIWNPLFPNGKDPAFFLDFVTEKNKKASYAASFAVDNLNVADEIRIQNYLTTFGFVSVRESSALEILKKMNIKGHHVCDPVILLNPDYWKTIAKCKSNSKKYIFYYDFDNNKETQTTVINYAQKNGYDVLSVFPFPGMTYCEGVGPLEFLGYIKDAEMVVTNSYHAILFSVLFHKPFYVFLRNENINSRIVDIINYLGLQNVSYSLSSLGADYSWKEIDNRIMSLKERSENYLKTVTQKANEQMK